MQATTAKLFATGGSQAVKLPAEFRFEGSTQVYIRRDVCTGDIILSARPPADWGTFMRLRQQLEPFPKTDMVCREQGAEQRDPFQHWEE